MLKGLTFEEEVKQGNFVHLLQEVLFRDQSQIVFKERLVSALSKLVLYGFDYGLLLVDQLGTVDPCELLVFIDEVER